MIRYLLFVISFNSQNITENGRLINLPSNTYDSFPFYNLHPSIKALKKRIYNPTINATVAIQQKLIFSQACEDIIKNLLQKKKKNNNRKKGHVSRIHSKLAFCTFLSRMIWLYILPLFFFYLYICKTYM